MNERFFADQRDYFKYSILRHLLAHDIACTVCWMLTPEETEPANRLEDYVDDPANWQNLDPAIFNFLKDQLRPGPPNMLSIAQPQSPITDCQFHWDPFPLDQNQRLDYFNACINAAYGSQLIFVDPDTGPVPRNHPAANKMHRYIEWNEIAHIYHHGFSILIYQHLPPNVHERAIRLGERREDLQETLDDATVHTLRADDIAFHFAAHQNHAQQIQLAITAIITDWTGPLLRLAP